MFVFKWLKSLLRWGDVEFHEILDGIHEGLADLHDYAVRKQEEAEELAREIETAQAVHRAKTAAASAALSVKDKLAQALNG